MIMDHHKLSLEIVRFCVEAVAKAGLPTLQVWPMVQAISRVVNEGILDTTGLPEELGRQIMLNSLGNTLDHPRPC